MCFEREGAMRRAVDELDGREVNGRHVELRSVSHFIERLGHYKL